MSTEAKTSAILLEVLASKERAKNMTLSFPTRDAHFMHNVISYPIINFFALIGRQFMEFGQVLRKVKGKKSHVVKFLDTV